MTKDDLITHEEAADILRCSTRTVQRLKAARLIATLPTVGRVALVRRSEVLRVAERIAAGEDVWHAQKVDRSTPAATPPEKSSRGSRMSSGEKARRLSGYAVAGLQRTKPKS